MLVIHQLTILNVAGAPADRLQVMGEAGEQFHPGQSATLRLGPKTVLARFGMLHPAVLKQFDIDAPVAAVELFLDALPGKQMPLTQLSPALQGLPKGHDFAGSIQSYEWNHPGTWRGPIVRGSEGYLLSRKAVRIVAEHHRFNHRNASIPS